VRGESVICMWLHGCMDLCKKGSLSLVEDLELVPIQDAPHGLADLQ
jgi:hypothetical protein